MASRSKMLAIQQNDPSGWICQEPTDADIRDFYNWIVETYGSQTLTDYLGRWDMSDV